MGDHGRQQSVFSYRVSEIYFRLSRHLPRVQTMNDNRGIDCFCVELRFRQSFFKAFSESTGVEKIRKEREGTTKFRMAFPRSAYHFSGYRQRLRSSHIPGSLLRSVKIPALSRITRTFSDSETERCLLSKTPRIAREVFLSWSYQAAMPAGFRSSPSLLSNDCDAAEIGNAVS